MSKTRFTWWAAERKPTTVTHEHISSQSLWRHVAWEQHEPQTDSWLRHASIDVHHKRSFVACNEACRLFRWIWQQLWIVGVDRKQFHTWVEGWWNQSMSSLGCSMCWRNLTSPNIMDSGLWPWRQASNEYISWHWCEEAPALDSPISHSSDRHQTWHERRWGPKEEQAVATDLDLLASRVREYFSRRQTNVVLCELSYQSNKSCLHKHLR